MNTILTDGERPKLPYPAMGRNSKGVEIFTADQMHDYARAIEAAVLAKLREQEPKFFYDEEDGQIFDPEEARPNEAYPLYAAPLPAVVPPGYRLVPVRLLERAAASIGSFVSNQGWAQEDMDTMDSIDAILAAPEAPAQGDVRDAEDELNCAEEVLDGYAAHLDLEETSFDCVGDYITAVCEALKAAKAPALPAEVREAIKVARWALEGWANHGTWVWPESALEQCKRNTTEALAAIARLDALGGGE